MMYPLSLLGGALGEETILYRVNAGGDGETADGVNWADDNPGPVAQVGGTTTRGSNALTWTWDATVPPRFRIQGLARTERSASSGDMTWTFDLTGYVLATVRVMVGEVFFQAADARIFSASVNGTVLFSGLDLFATYGRGVAAVYTANVTPNGSDEVVITFERGSADNPQVLAIEVGGR